jgi:uncharacterized membrane protein
MIHPVTAHFAVALPVAALLLSLVYLIKREEYLSRSTTQLLILGALGAIAAWYTGGEAGKDIYPMLTSEAQELLKEHKSFGQYTMIALIIAAIVKFMGCMKKSFAVEVVGIVLLLGAVAMIFQQGNTGGELVYTHGAGVENHADGMDCVNDTCEYIDMEGIECGETSDEDEEDDS